MILTVNQCKWLVAKYGGNRTQFEFIGQGKATAAEIEELKELDEATQEINGYHLITNYEELK